MLVSCYPRLASWKLWSIEGVFFPTIPSRLVLKPKYSLIFPYHILTRMLLFFYVVVGGYMSGYDREGPGNNLVMEPCKTTFFPAGFKKKKKISWGHYCFKGYISIHWEFCIYIAGVLALGKNFQQNPWRSRRLVSRVAPESDINSETIMYWFGYLRN